jgi:exopolysaccharide biosynthesis protein
MASLGAQCAMNVDGGGSSTMVEDGADGSPRILNSPIDNYIPDRERPVANHLGTFADR